ncbi:MAG: hypothetical protein VKP62_12980 [Candidatus Sericytochromatia bacterium]|nr:hypothetical protein [Candidatus Sericytochromatia bacterium]
MMSLPDLPALYEALRRAGEAQLNTIQADDSEGFQAATAERERLFAGIRARESELGSLGARTRAQIREVIQSLLATDERLQAALASASARTLEELQTIQMGLQALHTYGIEGSPPAYYIDHSR